MVECIQNWYELWMSGNLYWKVGHEWVRLFISGPLTWISFEILSKKKKSYVYVGIDTVSKIMKKIA